MEQMSFGLLETSQGLRRLCAASLALEDLKYQDLLIWLSLSFGICKGFWNRTPADAKAQPVLSISKHITGSITLYQSDLQWNPLL